MGVRGFEGVNYSPDAVVQGARCRACVRTVYVYKEVGTYVSAGLLRLRRRSAARIWPLLLA